MKKSIVFLFLLFTTSYLLIAQVPQGINYQTVVRNTNGNPVNNQSVAFRISVLEDNTLGNAVYTEEHSLTTNAFGLVNFVIGNGNATLGNFENINWGSTTFFIKVETDIAGGNNYIETGTQQLMSVPYALYTKAASFADSVDIDAQLQNSTTLNTTILSVVASNPTITDNQTLTLSNDTLYIERGNYVVLPDIVAIVIQNIDSILLQSNNLDSIIIAQTIQNIDSILSQSSILDSIIISNTIQNIDSILTYSNTLDSIIINTVATSTYSLDTAYVQNDSLFIVNGNGNIINAGNVRGAQGVAGQDGQNGADGDDGLSAYQVWLSLGNTGTETDFINSLKGEKGDKGDAGLNGLNGQDGQNGADGNDGLSAYQVWLSLGNTGTETDFINSLKGEKGDKGDNGAQGVAGANGLNGQDGADGNDGLSAYQVWLSLGNTGTETDFINSLKGEKGDKGDTGAQGVAGANGLNGQDGIDGNDGLSAYQVWLSLGNTGTETDFINSLGQNQTLSLNGSTLSISDGNSVTLPISNNNSSGTVMYLLNNGVPPNCPVGWINAGIGKQFLGTSEINVRTCFIESNCLAFRLSTADGGSQVADPPGCPSGYNELLNRAFSNGCCYKERWCYKCN